MNDELYLLEKRIIVANMENDIKKYGEFQCDWNGALRELENIRNLIAKDVQK